MKRFEVFLGTEFRAWVENDTTKISKISANGIVKITTDHPELGKYTTYVDTNLVPAYTIA